MANDQDSNPHMDGSPQRRRGPPRAVIYRAAQLADLARALVRRSSAPPPQHPPMPEDSYPGDDPE